MLPDDTTDRLHRLFRSEQASMFGRLAVRRGFIPEPRLAEALEEQRRTGARLGEILVGRGWITPGDLASLLAEQRRQQTERLSVVRTDDVPPEVREAQADPARVFDEFVLVAPLGGGGTAEVGRAWDLKLRRWVALKRPSQALPSPAALERFRREARAAARLAHPGIVPIYHVGEKDQKPFIVMRLIEGRELSEVRVPVRRAVAILRDAALAVDHAHRNGVVHRDLKPGNIMLDASGQVWLLDFGMAHLQENQRSLTAAGTVLGTPAYMSPEQARGESIAKEPLTDVYGLGATLYEMVTGQPPFVGRSVAEIVRKVSEDEPIRPRRLNPHLPLEVETILAKAMDKIPARRYASAADFAEDLRRHLAGEAIAARPSGWMRRAAKRVKRNLLAWALGTAAAAAAVASLVVWVSGRERARRQEVERREREAAIRERERVQEVERLKREAADQARFETERDAALASMRSTAELTVETALRLRRKGVTDVDLLAALQRAYDGAVARAPDLAELHYWMGRMMRAQMDDERALKYQNLALEKDPAYAPALYERIVLNARRYGEEAKKAHEIAQMRGFRPARREDLETFNPEEARLWGTLQSDLAGLRDRVPEAQVLAAQGILDYYERDLDCAEKALAEAVKKDPLLEEAWEFYALVPGIQTGPATPEMERLRLWALAEERYTQALAHDRGYVPHLVGRAAVHIDRGVHVRQTGGDPMSEYDAAEQDLADAIRLRPADHRAWSLRGWVRTNLGIWRATREEDPEPNFEAALKDMTKAIELKPDYVQAIAGRANVWLNRGFRAIDPLEDLAEAEKDFRRVLELQPFRVDAWVLLGRLHAHRGHFRMRSAADPTADWDAAMDAFAQAVRIHRENADIWLHQGSLRYTRATWLALGRKRAESRAEFAAAADDLAEALRLQPALEKKLAKIRDDAILRSRGE